MEVVEKKVEMRGMKRIEIVTYFISVGGKNIEGNKFIGKDWEVEIEPEKTIKLGSLEIPATIVIFRCEKESLDKIMDAFRLRFLSAGG